MYKDEVIKDFNEVQRVLKNEADLAYRRAVSALYEDEETENEEALDS